MTHGTDSKQLVPKNPMYLFLKNNQQKKATKLTKDTFTFL